MEGREEREDAMIEGNGEGALMPGTLSTQLNRITETARKHPTFVFCTLAHMITEEALGWSYRQLRRDAAAGVDEIIAQDYELNLCSVPPN